MLPNGRVSASSSEGRLDPQ